MRESLERGLRVVGVLGVLLEHPTVPSEETFSAGVDNQKTSATPVLERAVLKPKLSQEKIRTQARKDVVLAVEAGKKEQDFARLNKYLLQDPYIVSRFALEVLRNDDGRPVMLTAEIKDGDFLVNFISIIPGKVGYAVGSVSDYDKKLEYEEYNLDELVRVLRAKLELNEMVNGMQTEIDNYVATELQIRFKDRSEATTEELQDLTEAAKNSGVVQKWVQMIEAHVKENL